jgi:hypothetical protein
MYSKKPPGVFAGGFFAPAARVSDTFDTDRAAALWC